MSDYCKSCGAFINYSDLCEECEVALTGGDYEEYETDDDYYE